MATDFTPYMSLIGGGLIGLSATLLMLGLGRIAGATGILSGLIFPTDSSDFIWRLVIIGAMVLAAPLLSFGFGIVPNVVPSFGLTQVVIGGLIVGVGVSLASGCTSGHGICGLARLSPRSLVAVLSFMSSALVTVYVVRHVIGG